MIIRGYVNEKNEAVLRLRLTGPTSSLDVIAVIDTGFTSTIAVPKSIVDTLGLIPTSRGGAILADGSEQDFNICDILIDWGVDQISTTAYEVGDEVLIGMGLIAHHSLYLEAQSEGIVEIQSLHQ